MGNDRRRVRPAGSAAPGASPAPDPATTAAARDPAGAARTAGRVSQAALDRFDREIAAAEEAARAERTRVPQWRQTQADRDRIEEANAAVLRAKDRRERAITGGRRFTDAERANDRIQKRIADEEAQIQRAERRIRTLSQPKTIEEYRDAIRSIRRTIADLRGQLK